MQIGASRIEMHAGPQLAGPLYNQIQLLMRNRILAQEWREGEALPTEVELAREYNVSVGTMRKALDVLAHAKLIVRKQGLGTFIADTQPRTKNRPSGWIVDGKLTAETPVRVLFAKFSEPSAIEADRLKISRQTPVARISILGKVQDRVLVVDDYVVPEPRASAFMKVLGESGADLTRCMQSLNLQASQFVENLSTENAKASHAENLQLPINAAVLKIDRLALDSDVQPLFLCIRLAHLDRANYSVQLACD